jgi:autotransporter-associated beta strand protein
MSTRKYHVIRKASAIIAVLLGLAALAFLAVPASATTYYWDSNGSTAGAGTTPTGTWGTNMFWSTNANGTIAPTVINTVVGDTLYFSAGTDATGTYTVSLNGAQGATKVYFDDGTVMIGTGTITCNAWEVATNRTATVNAAIAGTAFTKTGAGTLILTASNSFTSTTLSGGGTLQINGDAALGVVPGSAATNITISGNSTLQFDDNMTLNSKRNISLGASGATFDTRGYTVAVAGTVSGGNALTKKGAGSLTLSAAAALGSVTVNAGTLSIAKASTLGSVTVSAGTLSILAGGSLSQGATNPFTVDANGTAIIDGPLTAGSATTVNGTLTASADISVASVSALNVGGTLTMTAGTLSVTRGNGGTTGTTTGGGRIILQGSSIFDIGGNSAGYYVVGNGGTLDVGPSASVTGVESLTVTGGGTLRGSGTSSSRVTINTGGHLAPGNSIGKFTFSDTLTLQASSILDFEFASTSSYDTVVVTSSSGLTINGGSFNLTDTSGATFSTAGKYDLIHYEGALQGTGIGALTVGNTAAGKKYTFGTETVGSHTWVDLVIASSNASWLTMPTPVTLRMMKNGSGTPGSLNITNTSAADAGGFTVAGNAGTDALTLNPTSGTVSASGTTALGFGWSSTGSVGSRSGTITLTNTANTSEANQTTSVSGAVVDNRTVLASSVALGRVMLSQSSTSATTTLSSMAGHNVAADVTLSAGSASSSSGLTNGTITLEAGSAYTFDGTQTSTGRGIHGVFTLVGVRDGTVTFTGAGVSTGEAGLTSQTLQDVSIPFTATAVDNRTLLTLASVSIGRVMRNQTSAPAAATLSSTAGHTAAADVTFSSGMFSTAGGVTSGMVYLSRAGAITFDGTTTTAGVDISGLFSTVGGRNETATFAGNTVGMFTAELTGQTLQPVAVPYTATVVDQRSVTPIGSALQNVLLNGAYSGTITLGTSGSDDVRTRVTVDTTSVADGNGVSFTGGTGTFFNTATSSGTRLWSGPTFAAYGTQSGTLNLSVTGEGLLNEDSYSPVSIGYSINVGNATADRSNSPTTFGGLLTASTPLLASYTDLESKATYETGAGGAALIGSVARIRTGTNSSGSDTSVIMSWRTRTLSETATALGGSPTSPPLPPWVVAGPTGLLSDVVDITGMVNNGNPSGQTDPYVLEMTYSDLLFQFPAEEESMRSDGRIFLAFLDSNDGMWKNAVLGDYGANTTNPSLMNVNGGWSGQVVLGSWGVDTAQNKVWAVVDHNSQFAVIPEPATMALMALGGVAALIRRRRGRK